MALVGFVGYAILKYGLFVVSPESAAENIIETMSDALIIIGPKGDILSVNNALLDMLGYSESELLGKHAAILWDDAKNIRPLLNELLTKGSALKNLESRLRKKNGELVGGDFLDLFELGERKVGIVVGDVSGKGLEASARLLRHLEYPIGRDGLLQCRTPARNPENRAANHKA